MQNGLIWDNQDCLFNPLVHNVENDKIYFKNLTLFSSQDFESMVWTIFQYYALEGYQWLRSIFNIRNLFPIKGHNM